MSTQAGILIGIAGYILIMVVVGAYAARRTHSVAEFAVAGRSLPLWLCTATIMATWFGGGVMIGVAGSAYEDGLYGGIADPFGASLALFLVGLLFVRLIRRLKLYSYIELLEQRFGRIPGVISALAAMISALMWVAGMLVAFGILFETLTGIPLEAGIIGGALIVIFYTSLGGMLAVALTDFVQMLMVAVGLVVLFVVVLHDAGGWAVVAARLPEGTFRLTPTENSLDAWLVYLRMWVILGLADIASQSLMQRAMSARSEAVAQNSFYLATIGYLFFGMIPVALGIIASTMIPGLENPEAVVPMLALEHLHPVAIAVFVGAVLAAIMSSCDSAILGAATVFSTNLLPLFRPSPSERLQLIVIRVGVPAGGIVSVIVALNANEVYDTVLDANMLILAAVIAPLILAVWWRKANRAGTLAGMAAGIATWLGVAAIRPEWPSDFLGFCACLATMLVVVPLTQRLDPPRKLVDHDGNAVELTDRLGVLRN